MDADREIFELRSRLAQARGELQALTEKVEGMRITGPGFEGNGPQGISYDPNRAIAGGGGEATATIQLEYIVAGARYRATFPISGQEGPL